MGKYTRYIIIADESIKDCGKVYSYFFGGAILKEKEYQKISDTLNIFKTAMGLNEIKRTKITPKNVNDYICILDLFFTFVKSKQIKLRIMYTPNEEISTLPHGKDDAYCKFYYTFLKIGFSIFYAKEDIVLRIIFDELPECPQKRKKLKESILYNFKDIANHGENKIIIYKNRIQEANSKEHPILQCIDVITGVIEYYLNQEDNVTSKKGQAKLKIFNHIYENYIKYFEPNFSFLKTTGYLRCYKAWLAPYKHIIFKNYIKKIPDLPT